MKNVWKLKYILKEIEVALQNIKIMWNITDIK